VGAPTEVALIVPMRYALRARSCHRHCPVHRPVPSASTGHQANTGSGLSGTLVALGGQRRRLRGSSSVASLAQNLVPIANVTHNKSLERSGKHRGPRLAAARSSWPPAQVNRYPAWDERQRWWGAGRYRPSDKSRIPVPLEEN
jgi:hypothetical protein